MLCIYFQFSLLGIAGAKLTNRLRIDVFAAMLKQEMSWFDDDRNGVGVLTTRLDSDTNTVQDVRFLNIYFNYVYFIKIDKNFS